MTVDNIKEYLSDITSQGNSLFNTEYKQFLNRKEIIEEMLSKKSDNDSLYPHINDTNFNKKIYFKKEFNDLEIEKPEGTVVENMNKICNAEFELAPHQIFVRNFLSFLTPYNSLLLYHGLGTGKTCSAISVCEEMRQYMKQLGISKKIMIVASPNVQQNFKTQLFDERKLDSINGIWNLKGCTGSAFIREINPMNMKGLKREKVIKQIKKIINQYYVFMGYIEFSNYISNIKNKFSDKDDPNSKENTIRSIKKEFSNRLIVIDEVHNIRISTDNSKKNIAENLQQLVKYSSTLKLLLLSATPMFNNAKEIVWLTNLMNINDGRPAIEIKDVFDKYGSLKIDADGNEIGKELLLRKLRGYVSFLRGENPFSFPYRIYPYDINERFSIKSEHFLYPRFQINKTTIPKGISKLDIFMTDIGEIQRNAYLIAAKEIQDTIPSMEDIERDGSKGMGWKQIGPPLQCLNMVYPSESLDEYISLSNEEKRESTLSVSNFISNSGLNSIMNYDKSTKHGFSYKPNIIEKYGNVFSIENLSLYSGKIHSIMENIKKSKGIVLIYSQYIDSGCVPLALALEELGLTRYSKSGKGKSLFDKAPTKPIDSRTMLTKSEFDKKYGDSATFNPAKYVMVTGDIKLSPNNAKDVAAATNNSNIFGDDVKVIIISEAGSEGIDFNNIRQIHIMEPWYNMSRLEQIIGRGVRFRSHCKQKIEDRNVEIYLYGTNPIPLLEDDNPVEPLDLYIYRLAEEKSIKIGTVSRILKENAVDCHLNANMNSLTEEDLKTTLKLRLSSGKEINYDVGDKAFTQICDYMEDCDYKCLPEINKDSGNFNYDTYNKEFIELNIEKITQKIKKLFANRYVYKKVDIIRELTLLKSYPLIQIDNALQYLIDNKNEYLIDMFGRLGYLININNLYLFQPIEIGNEKISLYRRTKPIEYKQSHLNVHVENELKSYIESSSGKLINENREIDDDINESGIESGEKLEEESSILDKILAKVNYALSVVKPGRGAKQWDEFVTTAFSIISKLLDKDMGNFTIFVLHHYFDVLSFSEKKSVIEFLFSQNEDYKMRSHERIIKEYITNTIKLPSDQIVGFILSKEQGKIDLWILNKDTNILNKAEPTDVMDFKDDLINMRYNDDDVHIIIGFISYIKKTDTIAFKTKNITETRTTGARCDQAGKKNIIKTINMIYGSEYFNSQNTKGIKTDILCVVQELLTRYYQSINLEDKIWFVNLEQALWNKTESVKK